MSQACKIMGYSRDSFYRFKELYETGGEAALEEIRRRKPNVRNRRAPDLEARVLALSLEQPAWGQHRLPNELVKQGHRISGVGVRCIWIRHDLVTMRHRLKRSRQECRQEGHLLSEAQLVALERVQREKEAHGAFESECPGYCGAQETFYVGTLKGVGRIYQQTFSKISNTRARRRSVRKTNGICERFNKTLLNEFYRVAFRKRLSATLPELLDDLDRLVSDYNTIRPHQGRWCYGKTPMQTFRDCLALPHEKHIAWRASTSTVSSCLD